MILDGQDLSKIKESQIAAFRRDNLGFVFQEFNLLDTFIIEDNIHPQEMAPEDVTAFIDQCYEDAAT